jgi:hypothetical protein
MDVCLRQGQENIESSGAFTDIVKPIGILVMWSRNRWRAVHGFTQDFEGGGRGHFTTVAISVKTEEKYEHPMC